MKLFFLTLIISSSAMAYDLERFCRDLKGSERTKYAKLACDKLATTFTRITVDKKHCVAKAEVSHCNDPDFGEYIYGMFPYEKGREAINCNMEIDNGKISLADCADL